MIQEAIRILVEGKPLTAAQSEAAMGEIMDGTVTPAQIAGLAVALRMRGETVDEVAGFARAMRRRAAKIAAPKGVIADTCGTGGDGMHTLNISTAAALVAAGAGVTMAKHGNRAMSSRCGSADVLGALGVKVDADPSAVERCLLEAGVAFCFAQVFHPAMKHAGPPRRELGVRTIFNLLGPLTNPAGASAQLIGVAAGELLALEAGALAALGTGHSLVVHGRDGIDELTTTAPTKAIEVRGHRVVRRLTLDARVFGFRRVRISDLAGGSPEENAAAITGVLEGQKGAFRDVTIYNAGFVCWLAGLARTPRLGMEAARKSIDAGAARAKLRQLQEATR
ncbi:MAG: anthranilate phosphoribosyltransferase [Candidatus Coatesbacteria bacterium]